LAGQIFWKNYLYYFQSPAKIKAKVCSSQSIHQTKRLKT